MSKSNESKTISVERLNIVDSKGVPRIVLAANLPNPRVGGKEYPRSTQTMGLQFNDSQGNEAGGIAVFEKIHGGALCFDYPTAEALCVSELSDFGFVGMTLLDKPPASNPVGKPGAERVVLAVKKGASQLTLNDSSERPRLILEVAADGTPRLQLLDAEGRPVTTPPPR